jgi:hypothetical protein
VDGDYASGEKSVTPLFRFHEKSPLKINADAMALDPRGPIGIDQLDALARWPMIPCVLIKHGAGVLGFDGKHPLQVLAEFAGDIGQVPHGSGEFS